MIMFLVIGVIACLIGFSLIYLYTFFNKKDIDMKKRCTNTVTGIFIKFIEKEIMTDYPSGITKYVKYFFPVYEYCVEGKRYEVKSVYGRGKSDELSIEKNKIVCYNSNKVEESFIKGEKLNEAFKSIKILSVVFFAIGIFFTILYFILKPIMQ